MRRVGNLWPRVVNFGNLLDAAGRAAKGKRESRAAARFLERAEWEVLGLQREIEAGTWRPGRAATFEIHDPKRRTISAVPFRDQVVHHALIAVLGPLFDRRMIDDSHACRKGHGQHEALRRARRFARRFAFFLKLDVRSFFASVSHDVVLGVLCRILKDRRVLDLCETVLRGPSGQDEAGRGLPIGSLTSQWFANLVLDPLDHHVKETLRIPGYVRYMDDLLLFADERQALRAAHDQVESFLADRLRLRLKERATVLGPVSQGIPFLGWQVFRGTVRLRPENRRRYRWRLRQRRWELERGLRSEESYRQGVASLFELLRQGNTLMLRRRWSEETTLEM